MELADASTGVRLRDVEFLLKAVQLVILCRKVLRWTYARAFYIGDESQRELFEFQQGKLEEYTEKLSGMTEGELDTMMEQRLKVLDWTRAVHNCYGSCVLASLFSFFAVDLDSVVYL